MTGETGSLQISSRALHAATYIPSLRTGPWREGKIYNETPMDLAPLYPCVVLLLVQLQGSGAPRQLQNPAQAPGAQALINSAH